MLKLALKNIQEKKGQVLLAITSLAIASASLLLFMGLNNGVHNITFDELEKSSPLTQITVRPAAQENNVLSFLGANQQGISQEEVEKFADLNGVAQVHPQNHFKSISSVQIDALGLNLVSDAMVFGVPKAFIEKELQNPDSWDNSTSEPFPVVLPSRILELYNLSIAPSQGLPNLNQEALIGKQLTLYPNYSSFFPSLGSRSNKITLEVVGFSDKTNLAGITLPFELVESLNQEFEKEETGFLEVYIETSNASLTSQVGQELEKQGYRTSYFQKNAQDVEAKLAYLSIVIGIISVIIFTITAIAITSTFLTRVSEKTKELGLLRALGASKSQIRQLILIEGLTIGIIGSLVGTALAFLAKLLLSTLLLQELSEITSLEGELLDFEASVVLKAIIFTLLLTLLASYLPARKAANISPIKAITT